MAASVEEATAADEEGSIRNKECVRPLIVLAVKPLEGSKKSSCSNAAIRVEEERDIIVVVFVCCCLLFVTVTVAFSSISLER